MAHIDIELHEHRVDIRTQDDKKTLARANGVRFATGCERNEVDCSTAPHCGMLAYALMLERVFRGGVTEYCIPAAVAT
jgi:hypothetical protein